MVFKLFSNLKNYNKGLSAQAGITLIEIIVSVFIITIFSMMIIADFPRILRQLALSRATYKLEQDFRRTQDLGLSGIQINNGQAEPITTIKGYGIYVDASSNNNHATQYLIYADIDNSRTYNPIFNDECGKELESIPTSDCIIETVDVSKENSSLYIRGFEYISGSHVSINFVPPNPTTNINDGTDNKYSEVGIVLGLDADNLATRTVMINTSGLINVK